MSTSEEKHARMDEWGNMKKYLNDRKAADIPKYKDGEIWWVAVGENVGIEINGKGGQFSRPVLVYKKFSDEGFAGIPLTSQSHDGPWYTAFDFQDRIVRVALSQIRVMSSKRLFGRIGQITGNDMKKISRNFSKLYKKYFP